MSLINMKGGNVLMLWSILLLAVSIWWTGVQFHTTLAFGAPTYPVVRFTLSSGDTDAYRLMIARLRELLTSHREYREGIPILREPRSVRDSERYILLQINVADLAQGVTFAIDVTNVYIIGYLIGNTRYFFTEAAAGADRLLFTDAATTSATRRSANYVQMESRGHINRANIDLGLPSMEAAIRTLVAGRPEDVRSLLVVIQMVAEGVRFWEIESYTLQQPSFRPSQRMIGFENNWEDLSEQIQTSEVFAFQRPINIGGEVVDNVQSAVIKALFLMLFRCRQPPHHLRMVRSVVLEEGRSKRLVDPAAEIMGTDGLCLDPHLQMVSFGLEEDDTCKHLSDPRSRIKGRDGLCVDVKEFVYLDNNPVILFTCKSSDFRNQLWNFQRDGRIVSMEKCLAASGDTAGSTVMIHECDTVHESAVQWVIDDSGTLLHRYSELALTAAKISDQLTLQDNSYSSFQAWESTNTSAVDVYIHGESNKCVYYNGKYGVYTQDCQKDYPWQKWRLYPDSTVRPIEWLDGCLELASLSLAGGYNYIQAGYCSADPVRHRWIFTHEGSIRNVKSQLVVDADKDNYLKAAPFDGGLNQIWTLEFI